MSGRDWFAVALGVVVGLALLFNHVIPSFGPQEPDTPDQVILERAAHGPAPGARHIGDEELAGNFSSLAPYLERAGGGERVLIREPGEISRIDALVKQEWAPPMP